MHQQLAIDRLVDLTDPESNLIFNMPLSDPETVGRAGELLTRNFA